MVTLLTFAGLAMCAGKTRWAGVLICMAAAAHWNSQHEQPRQTPSPRPVCTDNGTHTA